MWKGPDQDPGGGPDSGPPPGSSQELSDLKDQFQQQQVQIAQLKELLRKSEPSNVTQEKVDEYMNSLSKRSGRAKKLKKDDDNGGKKTVDIPASQKISLLRQQVEENKARLAERGKSQKGIEEMVTQLKAQLDDSQQLISQTPLNLSLQDAKVEYSENSSAQELYVVLLTKEKRISDLLAKVQKLESSVLDLQENVKEKDSVIDARTKAVTLMTENLSRKGKTTLDALDETKEQMRKMQENFISLEAEMKARQMKLLDDLRLKNYEIAELQEVNGSLEKKIDEFKEKKQWEEDEVQHDVSNEELETLKAENVRLQEAVSQKDVKIKELENNLDQLRQKESEDKENQEVGKLKKQLEESNKNMIKVKAQHKAKVKEMTKKIEAFKKVNDANAEIVKLESENCRLNQKVAELEEEKGSLQLKLVESDSAKGSELTERETELETKIQDHERMLEEKDKVISILEAEIARAKTEIDVLSDKLNSLSHLENAQVTTEMASIQFEEQMDSLENEKKKLIIENENTAKEKEELLETVEQLKKEKQEIATKLDHYIQENMELIDKLEKLSAEKVSSAESIEIVEGLTQQEKLELEAYQKNLDMVAGNLKASEENLPQVDLNESVNELTEETSELLQRIELFTVERREVMEKMEQLKQENNHLNLKIKEIENNRDVLAETYEQLQSDKEILDAKIEKVENENVDLKEKLNQGGEDHKASEELQTRLDEESNKGKELQEEILLNKSIIEEKERDLENLNSFVQSLQQQLEERNKENTQLNNSIIELNRSLADLENDNKSLQNKIGQLEEQKVKLSELIDKNQEELEAVSNTEWENRRLLESKDNEITKLMKERDNNESVIQDLQQTIKEKDEKFHKISSELKEKYLALQKRLNESADNLHNFTDPLQAKIEELTGKNKEQLEKMKKIAANLKKKNQSYQELEEKFKETQNRHETELKTSLQQLQDLETEVSRLQQQLGDKTEEVRVLEEKNVDLQNVITDLKVKADKNNELNLQQELLLTRENLGSVESSLQAKIQELEMIIETQESELSKSRERVTKLEEGISFVEERRLSLERKAGELGAQLEEKEITCEEMSRSEDMFEKRLTALIEHDEAIARKLEEAVSENQELNQQNQKLGEKNEKLKKKLEQMEEKVQTMEGQQNIVEELETQNENMKKQIHGMENELRNLQNEYDKMVEESRNDFDKINGDWQTQFEEILNEKIELMVKCEKFAEELKEISEKEIGFNNEMMEYKEKLEKSEAEIKNYEERMQVLSVEKEEQKREELEELRKVIEEKDVEIENYRKQNESKNLASFFDNVAPSEDTSIVNKLQDEVSASKMKIEELEKIIQDLKLEKTEQVAVTSVVSESTDGGAQKNIPTFVWSSQGSNDPFDFVEQTKVSAQEAPLPHQPVENTQQELLDKIKTLEFMLFNVEKDKNETLLQCHELSNELTRLVYERQMPPQPGLESQILQESDIRDTPDTCKQLQQIEFEATNPPVVSSLEAGPVVEEPVQAKEAYLCYADDKNEPNVSTIDSQVFSEADIVDTPDTRRQLQSIEFEETKPAVSSADRPVKEDQCSAKEAYLCYNTFGENDDGWGWGPEEGKLEEEHAKKTENTESLKDKIRVLEMERDNHLEEIKQLQIKSGKLIKKLKEFKAKNEELSQSRKKSESDLFSLDDAIQEELKLQILQVEKKLKETSAELEKEKNEKAGILKRVEVLTAANERIVEMKEKQDIELLGWQQNYREVNTKLERFEWGDDGFASTERSQEKTVPEEKSEGLEVLNNKIQELNETIKDLSLDNEELQALLEEQRRLRIDGEKSTVPLDYSEVVKDKEALTDQLRLSGEEKKLLQDQVNELIVRNSEISEKFGIVERQNQELAALTANKEEIIASLNDKLSATEKEKESLWIELEEKSVQINSLMESVSVQSVAAQEKEVLVKELEEKSAQIESLRVTIEAQSSVEIEKENLLRELQEKKAQIDALRVAIDAQSSIETEKEILFKELQEKNAQIDSLRESVDGQIASLRAELDNQTQSAQALLEEKNILTESLAVKDTEIVRLSAAMEQMTQEWETRIDQRGNDVAESWKLHLESRETEFAQIEQLLRKEINELEEKTNALVNENNELRKNVDAEIRNEVDRVAALQQQITDRQQYINELTRTLQEKQGELESLRLEFETVKKELDEEKAIVDAVLKVAHEQSSQPVVRNSDSLVGVFGEKQNVIVALEGEVEEVKAKLGRLEEDREKSLEEVQRLTGLLESQNQTAASLTVQIQEMQNLKDYENENVHNMQQNLIDYQQVITNVSAQLQAKGAQLEERDREIASFRQALEEKQREHDYALENLSQEHRTTINEMSQESETLKRRLVEIENHYEELLQSKDSDLEGAHLELQNQSELMANKNKELEVLSLQLNAKTEECADVQRRLDEQTAMMDEENKQLTELRTIIEEQVLKIEELKKELFEKSNDYDSLIAEVDISRTSVKESEESPRQRVEQNEDLTEPVSRAELDLALYMLHQRDVRCEELTVELTQLLEERDTLQLRLSNVLREKEELGRRAKESGEAQASSSSGGAVPKVKTEVAVDALDPLTTKLSELKNVGYKKDKTILDEQELRRFQQMSIMQQHRDAASKLPPEAAARLVDASYTLSRDVQSPSKVLLNWLWGRSTPKVNNI
jgi:chromosome segregation ATPase